MQKNQELTELPTSVIPAYEPESINADLNQKAGFFRPDGLRMTFWRVLDNQIKCLRHLRMTPGLVRVASLRGATRRPHRDQYSKAPASLGIQASNPADSKAAFTLAEVLITLGIIGVVAAITLPALITNVNKRINAEQSRTAKYKFTKATDEMKSLDLIGPYDSTEAFVNELKKHLKIAKICPTSALEGCWPTTEVTIDNNGKTFEISKTKTGKLFKMPNDENNDYTSDNIGIVTADGTPMIISYNKKCKPLEPEKTYIWATEDNKPVSNATAGCVAAIMDINGSKKPNKLSEDVVLFNAMGLGTGCGMEIAGKCFSAPIASYQPLGCDECAAQKDKLKLKWCCQGGFSDDYWAGAVKLCGGMDKMPTKKDLALIASAIYGKSFSSDGHSFYYNLDYNEKIAANYGLPKPSFGIWAGEEDNNSYAASWTFNNEETNSYNNFRFYKHLAVCLIK